MDFRLPRGQALWRESVPLGRDIGQSFHSVRVLRLRAEIQRETRVRSGGDCSEPPSESPMSYGRGTFVHLTQENTIFSCILKVLGCDYSMSSIIIAMLYLSWTVFYMQLDRAWGSEQSYFTLCFYSSFLYVRTPDNVRSRECSYAHLVDCS